LICYFTKGPDFGIIQPAINDKILDQTFDGFNPQVIPSEPFIYGPIEMNKGDNDLSFKIIGKTKIPPVIR